MSETKMKKGILDALTSGMTLRDVFAAFSLAGLMVNSDMRSETDPLRAAVAYEQADAMLEARVLDGNERERQKRLASIGSDAVQYAIDTDDCPLCNRDDDGVHDERCPVGAFVRDAKAADTLPAPAPDVESAADLIPLSPGPGAMVGKTRNAP